MRHWTQIYTSQTQLLLWLPMVCLAVVVALIGVHLFDPKARTWTWKALAAIGVAMAVGQPFLALSWVPPEKYMGDTGRIMYVHVPQVWMALIALTLNFGASLAYLLRKSWVSDALAEASAEVGVLFGGVGVTLGALWAKPTWGAYWTWDARLTTAAILLVVYSGYLALRKFIEDPDKRATWSAVVGIFAAVDIPVLWFSVKWWRSMHQAQSNPSTVDPLMTSVLRFSATTFLALLVVFIYQRFLLAQQRRNTEVALPDALPSPGGTP